MEKPKGLDLSNISVNFRWLLPVMGLAYFYAYQGDIHSIKDSISDARVQQAKDVVSLEDGQSKIWQAIASNKSRIDCIQDSVAKCCKDSTYCV